MAPDDAAEQPGGAPEPLDVDQCLRRLRAHEFGRVAVTDEQGPVILPVNYVFDRGMVVIRTAPGTKLAAAVTRSAASFEIDGVNERQRTGWSVVVRGRLGEIEDPGELEAARRLRLAPYAAGDREHFVALHPARITGYRIRVSEEHTRDPVAAPDVGNVWYGLDGDDLLG